MAFTVRFRRAGDDRQHGAGRRAANVDQRGATFGSRKQVTFLDSEAGE